MSAKITSNRASLNAKKKTMNKPKNLQSTSEILAREGVKPILACVILMLLFIFLHAEFLALIALFFAILGVFIFRNTERIAKSRASDAIIAPCDGKVTEILTRENSTEIFIKINIFDCGIFRTPARITRIESAFKFGLFLRGDSPLKDTLNTRHIVRGFCGARHIFNITLLPESWNKANIYAQDSSEIFAGDRLGFMKYGILRLEILAPCALSAHKGENLFAGESVIGRFKEQK